LAKKKLMIISIVLILLGLSATIGGIVLVVAEQNNTFVLIEDDDELVPPPTHIPTSPPLVTVNPYWVEPQVLTATKIVEQISDDMRLTIQTENFEYIYHLSLYYSVDGDEFQTAEGTLYFTFLSEIAGGWYQSETDMNIFPKESTIDVHLRMQYENQYWQTLEKDYKNIFSFETEEEYVPPAVDYDLLKITNIVCDMKENQMIECRFGFEATYHDISMIYISFTANSMTVIDENGTDVIVVSELIGDNAYASSFCWLDFPSESSVSINIHTKYDVYVDSTYICEEITIFDDQYELNIPYHTGEPVVIVQANYPLFLVIGGIISFFVGAAGLVIDRKLRR